MWLALTRIRYTTVTGAGRRVTFLYRSPGSTALYYPSARSPHGSTATTAGLGVGSVGDATAAGRAAIVQPGVKDDRLRGLGVAGRVRRPVLRWRRGHELGAAAHAAGGRCHGEQQCRPHRYRWHRALPSPPSPSSPAAAVDLSQPAAPPSLPAPLPPQQRVLPRPRAPAAPAQHSPPPRGQDVLLSPQSSPPPGPVAVVAAAAVAVLVRPAALQTGLQLHPAGVDRRQVLSRSVVSPHSDCAHPPVNPFTRHWPAGECMCTLGCCMGLQLRCLAHSDWPC